MLIFQYGSNTSQARLNSPDRLNGVAKLLGAVVTKDCFELDFTVFSTKNDCAAADIRFGGGRPIWGALYDIPGDRVVRELAGKRRCLDAIEGRRYERVSISVCWPDGQEVEGEVWTYTVLEAERRTDLQTTEAYGAHILGGLRDLNAPTDYIDYVRGRIARGWLARLGERSA